MKVHLPALGLAVCLLLTSCSNQQQLSPDSRNPQESQQFLFAMDTVMDLKAYGPLADAALQKISPIIKELEQELSPTDHDSPLFQLNHSGSLTPISPNFSALLDLASLLGERTGGALDITIYPIVKAWGFTTDSYHVPEQNELDQLLNLVDWSAVSYTQNSVSLPDGVQIDLGSLAKGYAGRLAAQSLKDSGVTSAILNLGGNVQTVGSNLSGNPWRIAVKDPLNPESADYLGILEVEDMAVVTSGGYERFFEQDGQTYWHIIDPSTGKPAQNGLISVTIVGKDGALDYWRTWGEFDAILVEDSGSVTITPGLEHSFTLTNCDYTLQVAREESP